MAIQRKPRVINPSAEAVAAVTAGAPDATHQQPQAAAGSGVYEKGVPKGNKRQISLTISSELLRRVDQVAKQTGQARAAVINMAIYRALEGDVFKG